MPNDRHDETTRRILIRESVPYSALRGLVDFLETHYLSPKLQTSEVTEYSESGPGTDSSFDLYWKIKNPKSASESEKLEYQTVAVHVVLDSTGVTIAFPGLDPDSLPANQVANRAADSVEFLATSFLAKAKRRDLYFIYSPGKEERMEAPRGPGRVPLTRC